MGQFASCAQTAKVPEGIQKLVKPTISRLFSPLKPAISLFDCQGVYHWYIPLISLIVSYYNPH